MKGLVAGLAVTIGLAGAAEARVHHPYRGHRIVPAASEPLDAFTQAAAAYSFRKLRSAYAGPAVRLRRASDNAELDIGFLGFVPGLGSPIDVAQASAFCTATTCFVTIWYDQSGNARDWVQAGAAAQPAYIASCNGTLPCVRATPGAFIKLQAAGSLTPVMPASLSTVAHRDAVSGTACYLLSMADGAPQNQITVDSSASRFVLWSNSASLASGAAAEATWHAVTGVLNGASSVVNLDGAETTGTVFGSVTAGTPMGVNNPAGTANCSQAEAIIWNAYALTAPERAALRQNQQSYWGTP